MYVPTSDADRLAMAVLRDGIRRQRLHETCAIRKCRRDGGCTGPIVRFDPDAQHLVPAAAGDDPGTCAPACCFAFDAASGHAAVCFLEHMLDGIEEHGISCYAEETRAIAARRWPTAALAGQPAPVPRT